MHMSAGLVAGGGRGSSGRNRLGCRIIRVLCSPLLGVFTGFVPLASDPLFFLVDLAKKLVLCVIYTTRSYRCLFVYCNAWASGRNV